MTLILTISNHAAINVAYILSKRGVTGFALALRTRAVDILFAGSNNVFLRSVPLIVVSFPFSAIFQTG
jgi:hypothetical protein